jgi:thioredoxin 1
MRRYFMLFIAALTILLAPSLSDAEGVDTLLMNAKKDGTPVMLELGSVGCIPCEQMKQVMEKLRTAYEGRLEVLFIDVRKDRKNARRFGVTVIPTQVFLDGNGKEFHRHLGYYSYEEIVQVLKKEGL